MTFDEIPDYVVAPPGEDDLVTDDGEPMESTRHRDQMTLLIDSLQAHVADRDDVYVSGNMFLYFSELQTKRNDFRGPDVFVVTGTTKRERKAWVVWSEEGRTPDLIIELTSDTTRHVDYGDKMRVYAHLKVSEYAIYDPWSGELDVFRLDPMTKSYGRVEPDPETGRVPLRLLGLSLGSWHGTFMTVECDWLRWFTPAGQVVLLAHEAERARADEAVARAEAAEARARELEARLRELEGRAG